MPTKFITKDIGMSNDIFVLENPNNAKPNSSGSGEAMMRAPKIGESHFMKPK